VLVAAAGALHVARSQSGRVPGDALLPGGAPEAELHIARMIYASRGGRFGFGGFGRPWWAIDYPEAEYHFRNGVRRLTRIDIADDSRHLRLTDEAIFDHPWMFAQQVGRWALTDEETLKLREYLMRGGFLVADDFHGPYEWEVFAEAMQRVFPDRPIVDIPKTIRSSMSSTTSTSARRFPGGGICGWGLEVRSTCCRTARRPAGVASTMTPDG